MLYLFDIDGTILLTGGAGSQALNQVFASRYGIDGAMDQVSPAGKTDPLIIAEMFRAHLGREPATEEVAIIFAEYVPLLRQAVARSTGYRLMPAVVETLDFLADQSGVHLALATGNIRSAAQVKLERAGLWQRFPTGGFGDDAIDRAELVQHAMDRGRRHAGIEFSRDDIAVVGDTVRDIRAAHACGIRCLAVATGSVDRDTLTAASADVVFDSLAELPAWHRAHVDGR